jgi:DNA-binding YbaB/EbfC family protein
MQQNMGKMLKSLGTMQKKMDTVQQELGDAIFEGSAANGLVKVSMTGKGDIKSVKIDPAVMSEDADTVGDLVVVATRKAYEAKEVMAKQKLATISSGLLPFGMKIPGLG